MKVLLVLFIAFTTPFVLFLSTIIYGGISRDQIKTTLAESGIYDHLHTYMATERTYSENYYDQFTPIVGARLTPDYLRTKTNEVIDDTANWLKGKSSKAPIVSLKELKQDLVVRHPDLIARLESTPDEKELAEAGVPSEEIHAYMIQAKQISEFTKNDFSFSLEPYLAGFKLVYQALFIGVPILIIILLFSVVTLVTHVEGLPSKFKWLCATFVTSAFVGFSLVYFNTRIMDFISKVSLPDQTEFIALISPIFLTALNHYVKVYAGFQGVVNIVFVFMAIACLVGAIATKKYAVPNVKPLKLNRSFWKQPLNKRK